jgi:hypothetical protein
VALDHFEPAEDGDPQAQRRMRGHLEQIDYIAFAANREILASTLGGADAQKFQRLALCIAHARARWIGEAVALAEKGPAVSVSEAERLAGYRLAFDELAEAYEAMRRLVERNHIPYKAAIPAA